MPKLKLNKYPFRGMLLLATSCIAVAAPAFGADTADANSVATHRPRIGLVLGGGGAKGAAHIGVLRVLDEMHIPIDCVAGTSMGALVGGTFATGMPADEIEKRVLDINWADTVGNINNRNDQPIQAKLETITYTNSLEFGIRDGKLQGAAGLIDSQNIEQVLRSLTAGSRQISDFNDLPIPFRAVATDMVAGEMVVLDQGDLSIAMRSSMSVPGAFAPVPMGDRLLSDGGMMRNLPVDVARGMCADVVIAVSLESPPPTIDQLQGVLALAGRSLDVMIDANQRAQIATLTANDVSIVVPMGDIGSADFQRVPDAIPLGRTAALAKSSELARYALPPEQYANWRSSLQVVEVQAERLAEVNLTGLKRVNPDFLRTWIRYSKPGSTVTVDEIGADARQLYALGDFEQVQYVASGPVDDRVLEFRLSEKRWGPDFVRADLGLSASGGGELSYVLAAEHVRTWLNELGGQWRNRLQIGTWSDISTSLYQPLDVAQKYFVQPGLTYSRSAEDIYFDSEKVGTYDVIEGFGDLEFGVNFATRALVSAGLQMGWSDARVDSGDLRLSNIDTIQETRFVSKAIYDTRNNVANPTTGQVALLRYVNSGSALNGEASYDTVEGALDGVYRLGRHGVRLRATGGKKTSGELPVTQEFMLGGIRSFPGLETGELRGDSYWTTSAIYGWQLSNIEGLFGDALFAGFRLTAGRMGDNVDGINKGTLHGAAVSLFGTTPLGSLQVSAGSVDNGSFQLQFRVGRPIEEGNILDDTQ